MWFGTFFGWWKNILRLSHLYVCTTTFSSLKIICLAREKVLKLPAEVCLRDCMNIVDIFSKCEVVWQFLNIATQSETVLQNNFLLLTNFIRVPGFSFGFVFKSRYIVVESICTHYSKLWGRPDIFLGSGTFKTLGTLLFAKSRVQKNRVIVI